ncbi:MAG: hypothetical protein M3Q48_05255 [Actinomycetota bacterium]|nr:hypothetical protein [Actinomycetota bacterium]
MTVFLVVGIVGTALVVLSLVFGELFEGVFDALDIDVGSGVFSAPVIGAFLAAGGFGGALVMTSTNLGAIAGVLGGGAAGFVMATLAFLMTRSLMRMPTDAPVRLGDVVGKAGTVVTRIPEGGLGEVSLVHLGQRMKLNARAQVPVPAGTKVVVIAVTSPSSVLVEPEITFWATEVTER